MCCWRRARQPARAHLPDQGHAGLECGAERGHRQAHRPLPVVPRLHDDLPIGRQLHAPCRSWPALDRSEVPSTLGGARSPPDAGHGAATAVAVPYGAARRCSRAAVRAIFAATLGADDGACTRDDPRRLGHGQPARFPGPGRAADAGRAVARLRPARADARDQRSDDPAADPARLRGCRRRRQRLLRLLDHHLGQEEIGARVCPRQYRRLGARAVWSAASTRS